MPRIHSKMKSYWFSGDYSSHNSLERILEQVNLDAQELNGFVTQFEIVLNKDNTGGQIVVNFQHE